MAKCANCGKVPVVGRNVSYAKNRTPRLFRPNLQKTTVYDPEDQEIHPEGPVHQMH